MADPFKYTITFENVSVGNGANEAAAGVAKVASEVAKLQGKDADLRSEFSALSDRFDVTKTATYSLGERIRIVQKNTQELGEENKRLAPSIKLSGNGLLQLAQAADDAQYGLRGVLNNIPGLVTSLGGGAGLAGALSIGSLLLFQFISHMGEAAESAADADTRIKEFAADSANIVSDKFERAGAAIDAMADRADALRQNWTETRKAEEAYSTAALTNAEKLANAQSLIAEALGLQVDRIRELEAIAARQSAERRAAAEVEIAQEKEKARLAEEAATKAGDFLQAQRARRLDVEAELVKERAKLELLQKQREELEKIAKDKPSLIGSGGFEPGDLSNPDAGIQAGRASDAQAKLDSDTFKTQLAFTAARVEAMEKNLDALTKDGGIVQRAEDSLIKAQTAVEDVNAAVGIRVNQIQQTLATEDLVGRAQVLAEQSKIASEKSTKIIDQAIEQINQVVAERGSRLNADAAGAVDRLNQLLNDQVADQNQLPQILALIQQFRGSQSTFNAGMTQNFDALIKQLNPLVDTMNGLRTQISILEGKVSTLQSRK